MMVKRQYLRIRFRRQCYTVKENVRKGTTSGFYTRSQPFNLTQKIGVLGKTKQNNKSDGTRKPEILLCPTIRISLVITRKANNLF